MKWVTCMIILTITLALAGCGTPETPTAPADGGLNLLVEAEGDVQLKRPGWSDYHATGFGAELHAGDQLRLGEQAHAQLVCSDLTAWRLVPGEESGLNRVCPPPAKPALSYRGSLIADTRGGGCPAEVACILAPRATRLLDGKPQLLWQAVPGATQYRVAVKDGSRTHWEAEINGNETTYAGPPLEAGTTYLLVVTPDKGLPSTEEGMAGIGFSLLEQEQVDRVKADLERLAALGVPALGSAYARAKLLAENGLYSEAIQTLGALAVNGDQEPAVSLQLGELYRQVGLPGLAAPAYQQALSLAQTAGDLETEAATQAGLGKALSLLGKREQALVSLQAALEIYRLLGDTQRAEQLEEEIAAFGS